MADLKEILRSWAAGREGVSQLEITGIEFDFDEGWPGTDVTPGDMPEICVQYRVTRHVIYKRPVDELGDFIMELAGAMHKWPAQSIPMESDPVRNSLVGLLNALEGWSVKFPRHVGRAMDIAHETLRKTDG